QRNETSKHMVNEVCRVCRWENPLRSGTILVGLVGFFIVTQHYSFLQILSGILMLAVSINLAYVTIIQFSQKVITDRPTVNPYSRLLNNSSDLLSKDAAAHYSSIMVDVAEVLIKAMSRIVLIEDRKRSVKWLCIFFIIWKISAYVSSRLLILGFIISAFIFPRLYLSNKDIVDARLQQGHAIINAQTHRIQKMACEQFNSVKNKAQTYMAKSKSTAAAAAAT
ncbi:MAG: Reticulon-domain-containing protein, partial [Benjaminiella poitrasii]